MKDIMLKIVGRQIYDGQKEEDVIEFVTEGKYFEEDGHAVFVYDESTLSGMEGTTTTLRGKGDKIRMLRTGAAVALDTEMEFQKGRRFRGYYDTPYGGIEMEILTNEVINNLDIEQVKGSMAIDYHISLKGLAESRSLLNIEIM